MTRPHRRLEQSFSRRPVYTLPHVHGSLGSHETASKTEIFPHIIKYPLPNAHRNTEDVTSRRLYSNRPRLALLAALAMWPKHVSNVRKYYETQPPRLRFARRLSPVSQTLEFQQRDVHYSSQLYIHCQQSVLYRKLPACHVTVKQQC